MGQVQGPLGASPRCTLTGVGEGPAPPALSLTVQGPSANVLYCVREAQVSRSGLCQARKKIKDLGFFPEAVSAPEGEGYGTGPLPQAGVVGGWPWDVSNRREGRRSPQATSAWHETRRGDTD